ncbi:MAG: hypothetical protein ACPG4U_11160 [Pseudomonadales bacterium]
MDKKEENALMLVLGQIKGELVGMREQIAATHDSTNRRIDDLSDLMRQQTDAMNRRIDDHQQDTMQHISSLDARISSNEEALKSARRTAAVTSGGVSAVIVSAIELIKTVAS